MRIIITRDYEELSRVTMYHLLGHMFSNKERVNVAITAGKTPARLYELLIPEAKGKPYLNHVHYYNFDEIPFKKTKREGITISELREQFLGPAGISEEQIEILNTENYQNHDEKVAADGGLDVMLLGIGSDGHFCGNMPGYTKFTNETVRIDLKEETKRELAGMFEDPEDMPDYFVTMGPASVMQAKNIILFANGKSKAEIVKKWYDSEIDESLPSSVLKLHPNLTVILDQDAASLL